MKENNYPRRHTKGHEEKQNLSVSSCNFVDSLNFSLALIIWWVLTYSRSSFMLVAEWDTMAAVCIVIYGASLVLATIEAGLKKWPLFDVIHIDPAVPLAIEQVKAINPRVVIVDGRYDYTGLCPSLLLRVDQSANNQSAVFHEQQYPIGSINELMEVIWKHICGTRETNSQLVAKVEYHSLQKKGPCCETEAK